MSDDHRLVQILDGYLADRRAGRAAAPEELLHKHPDLAGDLAECLRCLDRIEHGFPAEEGAPEELVGGVLGDFRIIREVGRGGMGVVYEAEQVSLGRRVALKVLPFAAVFDERHLHRFRNEAQAAAFLHHTHIVPVHAVGCERGVHYYAMQYIEGRSLAQIVEELRRGPAEPSQPLSVITKGSATRSAEYCRAVAGLGIQAAEALAHAHERGVIHRDIKPGNLLVDALGHLWVTDFGLASFERNLGLTMTGDLLGTVRYMSPEQALAKRVAIDHRTDLYSLGVTLYELLTLQFAFPGDNPQEVMRQIAFRDPAPARKLNPAVPVDLETILMKAMAKDPADRYASAEDLSADLSRFLARQPVQAKRPSLLDVAGKWVARQRRLVAAAMIMLAVAAGVLGISAFQISREQRKTKVALQRAEENFSLAEASVQKFLVEIGIDRVERLPTPRRRALLEQALKFYEAVITDQSSAEAHQHRARILSSLRRYDEALTECDRALAIDPRSWWALFERALVLWQTGSLVEADAAVDRSLAVNPDWSQSWVCKAVILHASKRLGECLAACDRAIELESNNAEAHHNRGNALYGLGRTEEALASFERAIELCPTDPLPRVGRGRALRKLGRLDEALAATEHAIRLEPLYAKAHGIHASVLDDLGRHAEALTSVERSIELDPGSPINHRNRSHILNNLGRWEDAVQAADRALELDPAFANAVCDRGGAFARLGRWQEALADYDRAIELDPRIGVGHSGRSGVLINLGRFEEALVASDRALKLDPNLAAAHVNRGVALRALGRLQSALAAFDRAIELAPRMLHARWNRGISLRSLDRPHEALAAYDKLVHLYPGFGPAHVGRGELLGELDRIEEAFESFDKALVLSPGNARAANEVAWTLATSPNLRLREPVRAARAARVAVRIAPGEANYWNTLGVALFRKSEWRESLDALRRSMELSEGGTAFDWFFLAMAKHELGHEDARDWFDKAVAWTVEHKPDHEELKRLRAEAAEVLGIEDDCSGCAETR